MKLVKCVIVGFGGYRQKEFTFEAGNQLLFGPNEIGKSTLYQFIQTMLFGFPARRGRQKDYTPKDGAAFGGKLWLTVPGYGEVLIERYKQVDRGRAKVVIGDTTGDEKLLKQLLKGLTPQLFSEVFTFQQEQLSQLEHLQENELQQALVSLGITGSRQLMATSQRYQNDNQRRFKPRGQRLPVNEQLVQWQQLNQQIREKEALEATVQQRFSQQKQAQEQLQSLRKQLQQAQKEQLRLKEQALHWDRYEEWQQLQHLLQKQEGQSTAGGPLTGAQQRQLQELYQEYQGLTQQLAVVDQDYHQAKEAEVVTPQYEFYLQHEQLIKDLLKKQVAGVRLTDGFQQDLQRQQDLLDSVAALEESYGWQVDAATEVDLSALDQLVTDLQTTQAEISRAQLRQEWLATQPELGAEAADGEVTVDAPARSRLAYQRGARGLSLTPLSLSIGAALLFLLAGILIFPNQKALFGVLAIICGLAGSWLYYHKRQQQALQEVLKAEDGPPPIAHKQTAGSPAAPLKDPIQENDALLTALQSRQTQQVQQLNQLLPMKDPEKILQDPFSYQQDYQQYQKLLQELETVTASLQKTDQAYGEMAASFDFSSNWLPLAELDLLARFEYLQQFDQKMSRQKQLHSQQQTTLLADQRQKLVAQQSRLSEKAEAILVATDTASLGEIPQRLQQVQQTESQQQRLEELTKTIGPLYPNQPTYQELNQATATNQQHVRQLQQEEGTLMETVQRQRLELEVLQKDGTLDELRQQQAQLETGLFAELVEWGGKKTAQATLTDLATDLSQQQLPQLLQAAGQYLEILTAGRHDQLGFSEGFLTVEGVNHARLSIHELSTGTKDQVIMAIRFGYLQLQKNRQLAPVIIDDGWLNYDSQRKKQLARLLAHFSENYQVICLSSDQEMVSYYQELQQPVVDLRQVG